VIGIGCGEAAPAAKVPVVRVLPEPDESTRFYWQAAARRELHIARCRGCGFYVHHPKSDCPRCAGRDVAPERVSGLGVVHSYTIAHRAAAGVPVPFFIALVELVEQRGLRLLTNLIECSLDEARIGMPVEVTFEDVGGGVALPQFRPRRTA
jgi:uncharacterized OB-fold protein